MRSIYEKHKNKTFDYVLSHNCPYSYMPTEAFMRGIDNDTLENRTKNFLEFMMHNINFKKWYCGHFHINKKIDKFQFLFQNVEELEFNKNNKSEL